MYNDATRTLADIDLAASIAAALHAKLRAPDITVEVSHGSVTLEGTAATAQERGAAEIIARRFSQNVTNMIDVKRPA